MREHLAQHYDEEETEIDLEILFNTIVSQPETVARIFSTEVQDAK